MARFSSIFVNSRYILCNFSWFSAISSSTLNRRPGLHRWRSQRLPTQVTMASRSCASSSHMIIITLSPKNVWIREATARLGAQQHILDLVFWQDTSKYKWKIAVAEITLLLHHGRFMLIRRRRWASAPSHSRGYTFTIRKANTCAPISPDSAEAAFSDWWPIFRSTTSLERQSRKDLQEGYDFELSFALVIVRNQSEQSGTSPENPEGILPTHHGLEFQLNGWNFNL